ncbi:hypothetical protein BO82DRAFT_142796 [Aspergillus uvarum CBS 121591]|uniref:Uncharacterized protein n=1 Tax=Aspergillus uvarum CBS 121591 TaxID=1448315 RepID=A0A319DCV5_9EURO|nr:hypothetical protein BO82DRAFT_142796 [Aspergillus uvarum CBS 121591]PYH85948.1 hypothetical protein BO82DRAFT_142796 [Aspergillus uvarum CBS 121591]
MRSGALLIACGFAYISPHAYRFEKETRILIHLWSGKSRSSSNIFRARALTGLLITLSPEAVCFIANNIRAGRAWRYIPSGVCALGCCGILFFHESNREKGWHYFAF